MKRRKQKRDLPTETQSRELSEHTLGHISGGGSRGEDAYFVRCDRSTITG